MKVGYTFAFHYSEKIRPNGKMVVGQSIDGFYNNCKYDFESFIIDNQSMPRTSFQEVIDTDKYPNMHYTYIEDQFIKGITGAWSEGINQAIKAGCDIIILTTDDVVVNDTINNMISHIQNDPDSDNSIYGPVAQGVRVPLQNYPGPIEDIIQIPGTQPPHHLGGHMYVFTKEFYHKYKSDNGDLFVADNPHNGGDGKWGGNEGNVIHWAEQGAKCIIVGPCWVIDLDVTRQSWKTAREIDRGNIK